MFISPIIFRTTNYCYRHQVKRSQQQFYNYSPITVDTVSFNAKVKDVNSKLFDTYEYNTVKNNGQPYNVHNKHIFDRLQPLYTTEEFNELFRFADSKGVFDLNINPKTHYITTSLINPKENPLMGKLVWVTDSCRYMPILKDKYPEAAVPLLENISKFYKQQENNFNRIINDPLRYELNHDWSPTSKNGIAHVFNPQNLRAHKWFPRTRLESPALYLQSASDLILEGLNGAEYGYKTADSVSDNTINAISNITTYFNTIQYPYSKSTGAWEEHTFEITTSSDVAIINEGIRKVLNLMYSKTGNPEILKIRERIINSPNGSIFNDEFQLRQLLKLGEYRIKTNSHQEAPNQRRFDGALSFIPHTEKFSDNPLKNATEIIRRMETLEGKNNIPRIVRPNGTIRYIGDRYLNMTTGHKINSNKLNKNTEAQWFMASDISKSYGMAVKCILDALDNKEIKFDDKTKNILTKALLKQTEYINRAYGRITGENILKANGKPCPAFQVPEAYQAVKKSNGEIVFVPGTHTPLGWAQASLYDASKLMLKNIQRIEQY